MAKTKRATVTKLHADPPSSQRLERRASLGTLAVASIVAFDEATGRPIVSVGGRETRATLDPSVDVVVLRTAHARAERVLVVHEESGLVVVGALRTSATPGVDAGCEDVTILAKRLKLEGTHELRLVSGASSLWLSAVGQLELFAKNITSRASSVHKIVGRLLHLN